MVNEYIEKNTAITAVGTAIADGESWFDALEDIPPADVVTRDCYDRILWENDVMKAQLASIGKKFGEKMDGVRPVVLCGDCRWFTDTGYSNPDPEMPMLRMGYCRTLWRDVQACWFCGAGEQKADEDGCVIDLASVFADS